MAIRPEAPRSQNMPRHDVQVSSRPPSTGATMGARMVMVWMAVSTVSMVRPRKVSLTMAMVTAPKAPLPTACRQRPAISCQMFVERAQPAEARM